MAKKRRAEPKPQQHRLPLDGDDDALLPSRKRSRAAKNHQTEDKLISSRLTSKILKEALNQQKEALREAEAEAEAEADAEAGHKTAAFSIADNHDTDEEDYGDELSETEGQYDCVAEELDEEVQRILDAFSKDDSLTDAIVKGIKKKDEEIASETRPLHQLESAESDFCQEMGRYLSRYTSGKIPRGFKHMPANEHWEDMLDLMEPLNWSPNAMYQATRIFISNLDRRGATRFTKRFLLPRVRHDIRKNKRLHFYLYQSLKKSMYKPAAFNKGILLPLCKSDCSLREAVIIGSIIQKVSIPCLHSSATLMMLAMMEYRGTTSYFIKLLLDKKYALPCRVLQAVLAHFTKFADDRRIMPVIWHQSLLSFVQRYKNELTEEEKKKLHWLTQYQKHHLVTPEILRELKSSRNCGEKADDLMSISSPISMINRMIVEDRWDIPEVPMEED